MGANSSGKTKLGNVMMYIKNYLSNEKYKSLLLEKVNNKNKDAELKVHFVEGKT